MRSFAREVRDGRLAALALAIAVAATACSREGPPGAERRVTAPPKPSILLVTLDTTRADAIGPEARRVRTPAFNALATRGLRFRQAYATVPETLPSHAAIMTGLYPAGHGIHENGRTLSADHPLLAERLRRAGYQTAAFVSSYILARRFGLARGFDVYDDSLPEGRDERRAVQTTDVVTTYLARGLRQPVFLWVHFFDPHAPYEPPEPYRTAYASAPYFGEVAAMDEQLGRLVQAFERSVPGPSAIVVAADHGEGLGDHGEALHGDLIYQATMHVPLVIVGPGVAPGTSDVPVSTRRIFDTVLDWAGLGSSGSLRAPAREVVLGECMKPFLEYGWQPQVMAVEGPRKSILAGRIEMYDVVADPEERRDLAADEAQRAPVPAALRDYPVPSPATARPPQALDKEAARRLASLGYVSAGVAPEVRRGAPRPADMVGLIDILDKASGLFVAEQYAKAIPMFEKILTEDPYNLDAILRLATSHSALGHGQRALALFQHAAEIAPGNPDVRTYLALHYARGPDWAKAVPLLEQIVAETPDRLPVLEALAAARERQGRMDEAVTLRQRVYALRAPTSRELDELGELEMGLGQTAPAIDALERARSLDPHHFTHDFELGLLYLDARRFAEARDALDRVPPSHPEYPMLLFKRAQVSVLLNEADRAARIARARAHATATTRSLIEKERLFQGVR